MTWLWVVLGALALLIGVPLAIGALLAREHVARVTRGYPVPPEEVWAAITGFETMAAWRDGVREVEVLDPRDGRRVIREHTRFGPMTYVVEAEEPPHRLVLRIADTDKGFGGTWTFEVRAAAGGSELEITEHGFVDSLLFRFMARFVFGHERTMRSYHESLARKLRG